MQPHSFIKIIIKILSKISKWCAYSQIYRLILLRYKKVEYSELTKIGRNIALLGLFCPFFWFALFSGADPSVITFHAYHSSIVFIIGIIIIIISATRKKQR